MASEWAKEKARTLALGTATETIATMLDAARAQVRHETLEEALQISGESMYAYQVRDRIRARLREVK